MVSDDATYRAQTWDTLIANRTNGYFGDAMRMFGLYIAGGVLTNPMTLSPKTPIDSVPPTPPITPQSYSMASTAVTAVAGTPLRIDITVAAPRVTQDAIIDLELYNATGNRLKQTFIERQNLTTTPATYSIEYTPAVSGALSLKGGIFTSGWASNLLWNGNVASVTVTAAVPPTPPPVVVIPPVPTPPVVVIPDTDATPPPDQTPPAVTPPLPIPDPPLVIVPVVVDRLANVLIWWPSNGSSVRGVQPLKAVLDGMNVDNYTMDWQVDGGVLNRMPSAYTAPAHKEVLIDVSNWKWQPTGRYTLNFVAKDSSGLVIAQKSTQITVSN